MSAARKMPSLGSGLFAALILSVCGAALLAALTPWLGLALAISVPWIAFGWFLPDLLLATFQEGRYSADGGAVSSWGLPSSQLHHDQGAIRQPASRPTSRAPTGTCDDSTWCS